MPPRPLIDSPYAYPDLYTSAPRPSAYARRPVRQPQSLVGNLRMQPTIYSPPTINPYQATRGFQPAMLGTTPPTGWQPDSPVRDSWEGQPRYGYRPEPMPQTWEGGLYKRITDDWADFERREAVRRDAAKLRTARRVGHGAQVQSDIAAIRAYNQGQTQPTVSPYTADPGLAAQYSMAALGGGYPIASPPAGVNQQAAAAAAGVTDPAYSGQVYGGQTTLPTLDELNAQVGAAVEQAGQFVDDLFGGSLQTGVDEFAAGWDAGAPTTGEAPIASPPQGPLTQVDTVEQAQQEYPGTTVDAATRAATVEGGGAPAARGGGGTQYPAGLSAGDQKWYDAFTEAHGGENMIDYYMRVDRGVGSPKEALGRAYEDRAWSLDFARREGRPPNRAEWESNYWRTRRGM